MALFSVYGAAGVLKFFGELLVMLGLLTRPVALVLAAQMVIAYYTAHAPKEGFPIQNGGELALVYAVLLARPGGAGSAG